MMRVWSHRPQIEHLGLFVAAYVLGCGFAQALAIVPGITVSIWPPAGVFIATLVLTSRYSWPWWILAGCLAEMFAQLVWYHSPVPAGLLIYAGNALCAVVGAMLIRWTNGRAVRLDTMPEVLAFVALGAGVAPLASATVGSATLAWFGVRSQTFTDVWPLFWIGDATGILLVAPLALVVIQHWRSGTQFSAAQWTEAGILGLIFLGVAALSLSNDYLPTPYIIMPPLLWLAVRFEFRGAAVALTLLALITMALTISGDSQFVGDAESQRERQVMLQLFLAISAFSSLLVAAISRQHQLAVLTLRRSMEALRDREQELSQLVDLIPSHVWRLTADGEPVFFNKRMVDFLGLNVGDMDKPGVGRVEALTQTAHPDDSPAFGNALRHCLATGERFSMRYRLRRADGAYHWMSSRAEPLRDQDGHIVQWHGICHDIDDQVQAEEALRRSERQLQEMIDAVPVRIWSATPVGGPVYFNKRYQDHFRSVIPNFEAIQEPRIEHLLQELVHPEDAPGVERALLACFETGGGSAMRFRWRERGGDFRWAECRVEPRRDHDGRILQWYGVSLDIDGEVRAQEQLRVAQQSLARASQAASLAELSASIAHEVNQPLAAIVANSDACRRWLSAEPPNLERAKITAERITRDANSAADVINRIRALFKRSNEKRSEAALESVVIEARNLMAEEASRRNVRLDVDIDGELPLLTLDRVQIQQVLVNLMRNGMEAMETVFDEKVLSVRARRIADVIETEISDRGLGFTIFERMFEPFQTTKAQGMGMGLAISRSIVESHGGRLWARKNEPQGATFIFTLPVEGKAAS
ncbi:MAG: PAS domain S-box protein [Mesorhizobium sp.]|nr:MAG: PAS domain S-box protein [Mesorhizobium sp.]